jgi:3-oxoacyl-[acyl-carrier-protein] synthase II
MKKRIVITGIGPVTSIGIGKEQFWKSLLEGKSGISNIESFDTLNYETKIGGEIKNFKLEKYISGLRINRIDKFVQFGLVATKLAIEDSGLNINKLDKNKIGIYIGSGLGGMLFYEKQVEAFHKFNSKKVHPSAVSKITPNAVSANIAMLYDIKGPNITISTACSSSNHAIGLGFEAIKIGKADMVIAGGTEASIIPVNFASFDNMRVMSRRNQEPEQASRPFDKDRDGFVMGEGAGILILESLNSALKRKAFIYAEISGYGASCGAHHMVMPKAGGLDAALAINSAVKNARIQKEKINYINAHGTSTIANDISETKAIKKVFGSYSYKIPISSNKSMLGHLIGAAGAIGVATSAISIAKSILTPTINYHIKDPECDLDYIPNIPRKREIKAALINSFGFGNNNACIILEKFKK